MSSNADLLKLRQILDGRGEINQYDLKQTYGDDYVQHLESWQKDGYIQYERDTTNPTVLRIHQLELLLDVAREEKQNQAAERRRRREERENQAVQEERWKRECSLQAPADATKLIEAEEITRNQKALDVSSRRLREIFGPEYLASLERLQEAAYLTLGWEDDDPFTLHLSFRPKLLEQTKRLRRKVSTQTTVDVDGVKKHIELRSLVGSLLGGPVDVVARACQSWLQDLEVEEGEHVKRQVHIYLERFEARWGAELDQYDSALYMRVCMALGKPQKASLNPILALDDMEAL